MAVEAIELLRDLQLGVGGEILREAGLVATAKHRYWTYYRLVPGALAPIADSLATIARAEVVEGERRRPCC